MVEEHCQDELDCKLAMVGKYDGYISDADEGGEQVEQAVEQLVVREVNIDVLTDSENEGFVTMTTEEL